MLLPGLEAGRPRGRVRTLFHTADFSLCPHVGEAVVELGEVCLRRALILSVGVLWTWAPPKGPTS